MEMKDKGTPLTPSMMSLHWICHSVLVAIIAALLGKLYFMMQELEEIRGFQMKHSRQQEMEKRQLQEKEKSRQWEVETNIQQKYEENSIGEDLHGDNVNNLETVMKNAEITIPNENNKGSLLAKSQNQSSVWCFGDSLDRLCYFENLCYSSRFESFIFFHGSQSVYENIPVRRDRNLILELSSVKGHNAHHFSVTDLPANVSGNFTVRWIDKINLIFSRFKPDNLMHVIHDDILPLHHTLQLVSMVTGHMAKSHDFQLVFMDGLEAGEFETLYAAFTKWKPLVGKAVSSDKDLVCFGRSFIGLSKRTTWYQYGFTKPQGPLPNSEVTSFQIRNTAQYLLSKLNSQSKLNPEIFRTDFLVLLSRKENRRILNEIELSVDLARETKLKVITLSFETHSLADMVKIISCSRGIIGMHGSLLALGVFLKAGSFIVELFPYAVIPENYTPFQTLAHIPGMNIVYKSWANKKPENTVGHSDWLPEFGGLGHLTEIERLLILDQTEVPEHLCCEDPSWLYHIYQDTLVTVREVTPVVVSALKRANSLANILSYEIIKLYPAKISTVSCKKIGDDTQKENYLFIQWRPSWNILYFDYKTVTYEIVVQEVQSLNVKVYSVADTFLELKDGISSFGIYAVWVKCVVDEYVGGALSDSIVCDK